MPILGSQSSGTKGAPTTPTIGTATVTNSTTVSIPFTPLSPNFQSPPTQLSPHLLSLYQLAVHPLHLP